MADVDIGFPNNDIDASLVEIEDLIGSELHALPYLVD